MGLANVSSRLKTVALVDWRGKDGETAEVFTGVKMWPITVKRKLPAHFGAQDVPSS